MKVHKIHTQHLRNDGHFQYHAHVIGILERENPEVLRIKPLFDWYKLLHNELDEAYKKISKSAITKQIQEADKARDDIWAGLVELIKGNLKHYIPSLRESARKLAILVNAYGNIARKSFNEQTSATTNILQEFEGKYAPDVANLSLEGWIAELKIRNQAFDELMLSRIDEAAAKNQTVLKDIRARVDAVYHTIMDALNTFIEMYGVSGYEVVAKTLNELNAKYRHRHKSNSSGSSESEEEDEIDGLDDIDDSDDTTENSP